MNGVINQVNSTKQKRRKNEKEAQKGQFFKPTEGLCFTQTIHTLLESYFMDVIAIKDEHQMSAIRSPAAVGKKLVKINHGTLQYQETKAGSAQAESCCVYVKPEIFLQHIHDILPKLLDCWADPVAHLLLLKSSMD